MLYDYQCGKCDYFMEDVYQSMKDEPLTKCPQCKKNSLERVLYGGIHACVKSGEPTTKHGIAEKRFNEGHKTMPDGRQITRVEWNKTDMVEASERRAAEAKERKRVSDAQKAQVKKIHNMTREQKINYIRNGDK